MNQENFTLRNGSRVAIVGGGPAGSFFALYLSQFAREKGINPDITIYQQRDFNALGQNGCKGCAGILAPSLIKNMNDFGLFIPDDIIQSEIDQYAVHSTHTSISISNPEKEVQIVSVYRGGGPRVSQFKNPVSFDGWLLDEAHKAGARIERNAVTGILLGSNTQLDTADGRIGYDLIVLSSGVNSRRIPIIGHDYFPPKTTTMDLAELFVGNDKVEELLGKAAHTFLIPRSGLVFGTLVPKGPFINVSLLSNSRNAISVTDFLNHEMVKSKIPGHYKWSCSCRPMASRGSAQGYFTDRFIAVGDAAVTRLYKDGIGSALLMARQAAHTSVFHGISRQNFKQHYEPFCQAIKADNTWGRLLFSVNNRVKDSRAFLLSQHHLISSEQDSTGLQPFTKAAWGMFTGSYRYKRIARWILSPASFTKLAIAFLQEYLGIFLRGKRLLRRNLHVGRKGVLILGSGFGGIYVLRNLVPDLNRDENVETIMISNENYFLFSALLHEVAMGRIESRHIAYPIRRLHWRDRFNFIQADVEGIHLNNRSVSTSRGIFEYDYLVIALGSATDISEFASNEMRSSNTFTLKTLYDSQRIRNNIIKKFEQATAEKEIDYQKQLLTFVITGAGYVGVQVAAELRDFIFKSLINYYKMIPPENIRIILIEAESGVVSELDSRDRAYVMRQIKRMGIEVRLKSKVTRVFRDSVEVNGSEIIPTGTIIWLGGITANPKVAEVEVETDSIGRIIVNEHLEVEKFPGVYVVGDSACFIDMKSGLPAPPRAHVAVRQAKVAAHNILADIRGRDKKIYKFVKPPDLISLGTSKALFRFFGFRITGFTARLIWLGAYSLLVTGTYNRMRIIIDWVLSSFFGRDTTYVQMTSGTKAKTSPKDK